MKTKTVRARAGCGTYAGYVAHTSRHEHPCSDCRFAATTYMRGLRQRKGVRSFNFPLHGYRLGLLYGLGDAIARGFRESA